MAMIASVKETLKNPQSFQWKIFLLKPNDVVEPKVFPVAVVMFLTASCSGLLFVLSPDMSGYLGIANKGWFFFSMFFLPYS